MLHVFFQAGSAAGAECVWRQKYPHRFPHSRKVFSRLFRRVRTKGIVQQHHNKLRNIRRRVRDVKSVDVIASMLLKPNDSLRRRETDSGISKSLISLILKSSRFHAYRMLLHQELTNVDIQQRFAFCNWIRAQLGNFHRKILWSDECTFKSDVEVNTWNCHYWSQENPHWLRTIDNQHAWKVNVLCSIIGDRIVGPIFFEGNLDRFRYRELIKRELLLLFKDIPLELRNNMWFQQDG